MSAEPLAPFPLAAGELARTFEREAQGWSFKRALEALLLELGDEQADHLQLYLREGRGAWLTELRAGSGAALFLGNAFSGTITALALQGFELEVFDPASERARFAAFRARAQTPGRVRFHASRAELQRAAAERAPALVVVEDPALLGLELELLLAPGGELVLTADNRLGYKRSLARKGEFRVPGPLEYLRHALAPERGERSLSGWRRALAGAERRTVEAYSLYPHRLDFSHVVALDRPRPALTIGPMEQKNRLKLAGKALGLFPLLTPSFAFVVRGTPAPRARRIERVLVELAARLGEAPPEVETIVSTRGNSAVLHTARADGSPCWTLHVPLAPKNFPQVERHVRMLRRARELLPGLRVPEALFWGTLDGLTFACERRLPGWTAPQSSGDQPRIARMLGEAAQMLGGLTTRPARALDEATFEEQIAQRFRLVIEHAAVPSTIARLERLLAEMRERLLGRPLPLVFYHADLRAKHVQVDAEGHVLGLLDWGTAEEQGPPCHDLLQLLVHEVKQEHGLSAGEAWRRVRARELRPYESECLERYRLALGLEEDVQRAFEEMYPVLVAAMAEKHWDYSRPRWLHRQFGL